MAKSTVYFTKEITPEAVLKMYRQLGVELPGKVAVKVHSGEDGNQNFLRPEFMKPVIDAVHGIVVRELLVLELIDQAIVRERHEAQDIPLDLATVVFLLKHLFQHGNKSYSRLRFDYVNTLRQTA